MNGRKKQLQHMAGIITCHIFLFIICCVIPSSVFAAAWTLPKGESSVITSALLYRSDTFVDEDGTHSHQKPFRKLELNPYIEYGLTDHVTFGMNTQLQAVAQTVDERNLREYALADTELFLRQKLKTQKNWFISWQPLIKLPGIYQESSPLFGQKTTDVELRLLAAYQKEKLSGKIPFPFVDMEVAYRKRLSGVSDEWRMDSTLGIPLTTKWQLLLQQFSTLAANGIKDNTSFIESNSSDYHLVKYQGSAVYTISPRVSVQMGVTKDVWARNTGKGQGVLTALWVKF